MTKKITSYFCEGVVIGESATPPADRFAKGPQTTLSALEAAIAATSDDSSSQKINGTSSGYQAKPFLTTTVSTVIFLGAKFSTAYLGDAEFAKTLGFYDGPAAEAKRPGTARLFLRNFSDLGALGFAGEVSFNLVPAALIEDPSWGPIYRTYVPYSKGVAIESVTAGILAHIFSSRAGVPYKDKVVPGTLSIKHSRKMTSRIG